MDEKPEYSYNCPIVVFNRQTGKIVQSGLQGIFVNGEWWIDFCDGSPYSIPQNVGLEIWRWFDVPLYKG